MILKCLLKNPVAFFIVRVIRYVLSYSFFHLFWRDMHFDRFLIDLLCTLLVEVMEVMILVFFIEDYETNA
jgi:hypothetical protein